MTMLGQTQTIIPPRHTPPDGAAAPGGGPLQSLRDAAAQHRDAARAVIDDALSADSEAFLRANRQQSGQ